jgi:hypothetical protein
LAWPGKREAVLRYEADAALTGRGVVDLVWILDAASFVID